MKHKQVIAQEPYEAPAILDIAPVSFTSVFGDSTEEGEADDDDY